MGHSLFLVFFYLLLPLPSWASSAESTSSATTKDELGLTGLRPDPFVAASPLIVAAVCSDGIVLVAAHTVAAKEKLLRDFGPEDSDNEEERRRRENENNVPIQNKFEDIWKDLPSDHGGPYRINRIDRSGTHLLTAGWRADCDFLVEKIRSIASQEVARFGKPQWGLPYGRLLAQEASFWMAQLAVSGSFRPLSAVGLLAACSSREGEAGFNGCLWFADETGAYRVRALAIGGGKADGRDEEKDCIVAQLVNSQLQEADFSTMTAREGASHILKIICGQSINGKEDATRSLVPSGCEMEVACIMQPNNLQRLRLSTLSSSMKII